MPARTRKKVAIADTDGHAKTVEAAVQWFAKHGGPPLLPMVSVPGLSPEFLHLAIDLDVALTRYRQDQAAFMLIRHYASKKSVNVEDCPALVRLDDKRRATYRLAGDAMRAIRRAPAVTAGDRKLKKYADRPGFCPNYRQVDWEPLLDCEIAERMWEQSSTTRRS